MTPGEGGRAGGLGIRQRLQTDSIMAPKLRSCNNIPWDADRRVSWLGWGWEEATPDPSCRKARDEKGPRHVSVF